MIFDIAFYWCAPSVFSVIGENGKLYLSARAVSEILQKESGWAAKHSSCRLYDICNERSVPDEWMFEVNALIASLYFMLTTEPDAEKETEMYNSLYMGKFRALKRGRQTYRPLLAECCGCAHAGMGMSLEDWFEDFRTVEFED